MPYRPTVLHTYAVDALFKFRAGDASGAQAPPLTHLRANVGYAWSSLRAVRPNLVGVAGPMAGVALLLAVRLMGLQVIMVVDQDRRRGEGAGQVRADRRRGWTAGTLRYVVRSLLRWRPAEQSPSGPGRR